MNGQQCLQCRSMCYAPERYSVGEYFVHPTCLMCSICQTKLDTTSVYVCESTLGGFTRDRTFCKQHASKKVYRREIDHEELRLAYEKLAAMSDIRSSFNVPIDPSDSSSISGGTSIADNTTPRPTRPIRTSWLDKGARAFSDIRSALTGVRFVDKKRPQLRFKGFSAPRTPSIDGPSAQVLTLVGHTADQMDKWDVATALGLEGAAVEEPGLFDPPTVEVTRRPDAAERSRRPRPQAIAIADRDGLFGPPDLIASLCQLWSVDTVEQFAASTDGRDIMDVDEEANLEPDSSDLLTIDEEAQSMAQTQTPAPTESATDESGTQQEPGNDPTTQADEPVPQTFRTYKDTVKRRRSSAATKRMSILSNTSNTSILSRKSLAPSVSATAISIKSYEDSQTNRTDITTAGVVAKRKMHPEISMNSAEDGSIPYEPRRKVSRTVSGRKPIPAELINGSLGVQEEVKAEPEVKSVDIKGKSAKRDSTNIEVSTALLQELCPLNEEGDPIDADLIMPTQGSDKVVVQDGDEERAWNLTPQEAVKTITEDLEAGTTRLTLMWEEVPEPVAVVSGK